MNALKREGRRGRIGRVALPVAVLVTGLALTACNQDEDRVLVHEPGVYQGQPDQSIDQSTRDVLRQRALRQSNS